MSAGIVLGVAGLACSSATGQIAAAPVGISADASETMKPTSVQPILGVRMDGRLVLGETVTPGVAQDATARGGISGVTVYDSLWLADTDSDGVDDLVCGDLCGGLPFPASRWFFNVATPAWVDDVEFTASTVAGAPIFDGFGFPVDIPACGNGVLEPLILIATMYDSPVTGFDTDGDGQIDSPYARTDTDSDGLVDQFSAGVVLTFADTDIDGDGANDILDVSVGRSLFLSGLNLSDTDQDGIPGDPGALDFGGFPSGDSDGDGRPDGAFEIFFAGTEGPDTDGDGLPDSGSIYNAFEASRLSPSNLFWGTPDADNSGCAAANGITEGSSGGVFWSQSEQPCMPGTQPVDNQWDPSTDFTDLAGAVPCPDPLTPAIIIQGLGFVEPGLPCADTNGDGAVTPADFNAWILAFNSQSPACDQNGDGLCTPADFNAWVINFNSGEPCP